MLSISRTPITCNQFSPPSEADLFLLLKKILLTETWKFGFYKNAELDRRQNQELGISEKVNILF